VLLEDGQRHRTDGENGVVEAALIELRAELLLGLAVMPDLQRPACRRAPGRATM
jgi:hypothetical protein